MNGGDITWAILTIFIICWVGAMIWGISDSVNRSNYNNNIIEDFCKETFGWEWWYNHSSDGGYFCIEDGGNTRAMHQLEVIDYGTWNPTIFVRDVRN
jgi:hypothetical protein